MKKINQKELISRIESCITYVNIEISKNNIFKRFLELNKVYKKSKGSERKEIEKEIIELKKEDQKIKRNILENASIQFGVSIVKIKQILNLDNEDDEDDESLFEFNV